MNTSDLLPLPLVYSLYEKDKNGNTRYILTKDFKWVDPIHGMVIVPRGFITDGASIPKDVWSLIGLNPFSCEVIKAAVIHDWLYCTRPLKRSLCDKIFRRILRYEGQLSDPQIFALYQSVNLFGGTYFDAPISKSEYFNLEYVEELENKSRKLVGICVGYSRFINGSPEGGSLSYTGVSEYEYNSEIAKLLKSKLSEFNINSKIYDKYEGSSYNESMTWLANQLNNDKVDIAIELHFNEYTSVANGFEYIYWYTSKNGKRLAQCLADSEKELFPSIRARGTNGIKVNGGSSGEGRFELFNKKPIAPTVICEPFFGNNPTEWDIFSSEEGKQNLAKSYSIGIKNYFN